MGKIIKVFDDGVHKTYSFMGIRIHRRNNNRSFNISARASMFANSVAKTHSASFDEFKGCNTGKSITLIATGPSLARFKPINDTKYIGVNKAYKYDKVELDYLFIQDFASKEYITDLSSEKYSNIIKFIGILPKKDIIIPESLSIKLRGKRYYTDESIRPHQFTYDISTTTLGDFSSVIFPAMQFALWTNPSKIYLVGCDCSSGYFDNTKSQISMEHLVSNWKKLKEFSQVYYPSTEIISINPVGLKKIFKYIIQD